MADVNIVETPDPVPTLNVDVGRVVDLIATPLVVVGLEVVLVEDSIPQSKSCVQLNTSRTLRSLAARTQSQVLYGQVHNTCRSTQAVTTFPNFTMYQNR